MKHASGFGLGSILAAIITLAVFSQPASASVDEKVYAFVLCKNVKDVRTIRILGEGEKQENCKITYSKGSNEETVGVNRSINSCKSILKSIQNNLEASKWSCRSVQTANVTTGSQAVQ